MRRALVIAPKTVAEATWTAEAAKWEHLRDLRVVPVLGSADRRRRALDTPGDIWVINRENIPWLTEELKNGWDFDTVVLDESTSFKNPQSKRFRALRSVRKRISRVIELTGTPSPNGLEDLWAQIWLLDGGERLGRTLTAYREAYFKENYAYPGQAYRTYSPVKGADRQIMEKLEGLCVSMKAEDWLTLPEFIEQDVPVALDEKSRRAYEKFERDAVLELAGEEVTATSAAALSGKLLQLCGGAVYDAEGRAQTLHGCKLAALMELVEQLHGEHALVCYWFQHERDRLMEALSGCGLRVKVYGGPEDGEAWNRGEVELMLIQPASCGYGLNLQEGGRHIIWYGLPNWNLELYQQTNKRLHRQGQTKPVVCHCLCVQGGMDESVLQALRGKGDMQEALMQALKARIDRYG